MGAKVFDRTTFFSYARKAPFGGRLTQQQVDGMNLILDTWETVLPKGDLRWLAYILATAFHETGGKMIPLREGFKKTDSEARAVVAKRKYGKPDPVTGHVYYGRGLVQLTWNYNYKTMGQILGKDLYNNPDLALDPITSVQILIEGMTKGASGKGDFTGKGLEDYFNGSVDDPINARRIVNGTDKAKLISTYHIQFLDTVKAALIAEANGVRPVDAKPEEAKADGANLLTGDKTSLGGIISGLGGAGGLLGGAIGAINNQWALIAFAIVAIGAFLVITGRVELKYKKGA